MSDIKKAISLVEMVETLLAGAARGEQAVAALPLEGMQLTLEQVRRLLVDAALNSELSDRAYELGMAERRAQSGATSSRAATSNGARRMSLAERVQYVPEPAVGGFVRELEGSGGGQNVGGNAERRRVVGE